MTILIATVGTSLLGHWKQAFPDFSDRSRIGLIQKLKQLPDGDRRLGAEVCSISSLMKEGKVAEGDSLYLCVSETDEGRFTGEAVKGFYKDRFRVEVKEIAGLQGKDPKRFQAGLRNLVNAIAEMMKKHPGERLIINATGGYKAQISFAGLIGQAFTIPVYYQFEDFSTSIALPPLPVSWNFDLWLNHYELLEDADHGISGNFLPAADPRYKKISQEMGVLFDEEEAAVILSPLGVLFHRGFAERFPRHAGEMLPKFSELSPSEKAIVFEDKNAERHKGLRTFLERIRDVNYVTRVNTWYYNPDLPERKQFRASSRGEDRVEGWFSDGKATTKFDVFITPGSALKQRQAAVIDLNRRFIN